MSSLRFIVGVPTLAELKGSSFVFFGRNFTGRRVTFCDLFACWLVRSTGGPNRCHPSVDGSLDGELDVEVTKLTRAGLSGALTISGSDAALIGAVSGEFNAGCSLSLIHI